MQSDPVYIFKIFEYLSSFYQSEENINALKRKIKNMAGFQPVSFEGFLNELIDVGYIANLGFLEKEIEENAIVRFIESINYPVILFRKRYKFLEPLIIRPLTDNGFEIYDPSENITTNIQSKELPNFITENKILKLESGQFKIILPFKNESLFSFKSEDRITPLKRFFNLLKIEKRDIVHIYTFAILIGLIGLTLPLGVQAIISLISGGMVISSVYVIVGLIISGIILSGFIQILQMSLIEVLQQRLFTRLSFELTSKIIRVKFEETLKHYMPEQMNRFFDVLTIQKGISKILLDITTASMQIVFGLILLALYHPVLVAFGLFVFSLLIIFLRSTAPAGLKSSLNESKYKYKVAYWLQELARTLTSFKLIGYSNYPLERSDDLVSNYLKYRKTHFAILKQQFLSLVLFRSIITTGILILGIYFVSTQQITIAQFVASEIVIVLINGAVEKLIFSVDVIYDMLTASEKIGSVTDLKSEDPSGITLYERDLKNIEISIKNLVYTYPDSPKPVLDGINLSVKSGEHISIVGESGSGKNSLLKVLNRMLDNYQGSVTFNNISIKNINKHSLRSLIGDNFYEEGIFNGTIEENITLGRNDIYLNDVIDAVSKANLNSYVNTLSDGLNTELRPDGYGLTRSIKQKILFARAVVGNPPLLLFEDNLFFLNRKDKAELLSNLMNEKRVQTMVFLTNDLDVIKCCDKVAIMDSGKVLAFDTYEALSKDENYKRYFEA